MRQFTALFKKEIGDYVKSPFAYALFVLYLMISIAVAFYFGSYLAMHDTALFSLFFAQPVILAVLIPAMTMRVWSEEYKTGTIEYLLTQPISDEALVLAKTLAATSFWLLSGLFLAPFIVYTSTWVNLDFRGILAGYTGLWLVMTMFCALGCLISFLNKSQILSYVVALMAMLGFIGWRFLDFYAAYNNFMFAEISPADILYFVVYIAVFIFLNIMFLTSRRLVAVHKTAKLCGAVAAILLSSVLLLKGLNFMLSSYRFDLTSSKIYSLKEPTKKIIHKIESPMTIDLYIAKDYANYDFRMRYYAQQIEHLLHKYELESKGMIRVRTTKVEPFSELEKSLLKSGLYYETNAGGSRNYFGAILRNAVGKAKAVAHFIPERFAFAEKDIDEALLQLYDASLIKNIGIFLDGRQNLEPFTGFLLDLENDYNVFRIDDDVYQISPELDLLILLNPKDISGDFMYAVDQYVMHGGKTLIFFDHLTRSQTELANMESIRPEILLQMWGVELTGEMTDEGKLNRNFFVGVPEVKIDTATVFTVKNSAQKVTPLIVSEKGYVGALIGGSLTSAYEKNILHQGGVMPHKASTEDARLAVIGDVDVLDETTWINPSSPDRNPYSIIPTAGNGQAMRFLVDALSGNKIYNLLPINNGLINEQSIGQKLMEKAYRPYAEEYEKIVKELSEKKLAMYVESGEDFDKMNTLMQVTAAGEEIADLEKTADSIDYKIKRTYQNGVITMAVINILLIPLLAAMILWLLGRCSEKRKRRKMTEIFDE